MQHFSIGHHNIPQKQRHKKSRSSQAASLILTKFFYFTLSTIALNAS